MSDWHYDWFYGFITTLLVFPLWATWLSGNKIRLLQRGIGEPFMLALLIGVPISIYSAVSGDWHGPQEALALSTGVALLVTIMKGKRGTLVAKEEDEE